MLKIGTIYAEAGRQQTALKIITKQNKIKMSKTCDSAPLTKSL
jgi:hypothetical protein